MANYEKQKRDILSIFISSIFTFFLFLMMGCGRNSSMEKARSRGSNDMPGMVAWQVNSVKYFYHDTS